MTSRSDFNFGIGLKKYLKDRGIRQGFIAERIGVSPQMFHQWCKSPDVKFLTAVRIADGLGITVAELANCARGANGVMESEQPMHV
jgi:transcriptional regulator with XRE-family HTH domain